MFVTRRNSPYKLTLNLSLAIGFHVHNKSIIIEMSPDLSDGNAEDVSQDIRHIIFDTCDKAEFAFNQILSGLRDKSPYIEI